MLIGIIFRHLIDIDTHLQVDKDGTLTGIDTFPENTQMADGTNVKALLFSNKVSQ